MMVFVVCAILMLTMGKTDARMSAQGLNETIAFSGAANMGPGRAENDEKADYVLPTLR